MIIGHKRGNKRDGHQKQCSGRQWHLNNARLALRGLKCAKKTSPHTITPPACTVVTRHDRSMFSFCLRQILTQQSVCQSGDFNETERRENHWIGTGLNNITLVISLLKNVWFKTLIKL